jgi:hypothetical protein
LKTKKLSKKLSINKKTIANLKGREMKDANGGIQLTFQISCLEVEETICVTNHGCTLCERDSCL